MTIKDFYTPSGYLCVKDCPATLAPITMLESLMFVEEVK